jgi:iron complex transport system ATP-binding protein
MIRLQELGCRFGSHTVLENITTDLQPGCVALIGPNGAGKSTLLRLCADGGRYFSSAHMQGSIMLDQQPLAHIPADTLARRRAFLPQQHTDALALPVNELLCLAAWPHGGGGTRARELYQEALARWELEALATRRYDELSGGERQRVQLARTWLQMRLHENAGERIWLLDEPQNALDLPHQQQLRQTLRHEADAGALVLFSTHDINFALRSADQFLLLKNGRLVASGTPELLADTALLQSVFGVGFDRLTHPVDGRPWLLPH